MLFFSICYRFPHPDMDTPPNSNIELNFKGDWDVTSGKLVSGRVSISRSGGDMGCRLVVTLWREVNPSQEEHHATA
jgi:hypothetical protein